MARAAAKRKPRPKEAPRRAEKRVSAPQPVEKTLFFNRIRRQTKWVFAVLALVFAVSFVVAGVGSGSTGFGSIVDALGGIFGTNDGGSSNPSVKKAQDKIYKNPKDAAAYRELARAYELDGNTDGAIGALEDYLRLNVVKSDRISALNELAGLYETKARQQLGDVQLALYNLQTVSASDFGPSPTSPLGKAYAANEDPIRKAMIEAAQQRYQELAGILGQTYQSLTNTYKRLTTLDPTEPSYLLLYAQTAQNAGDANTALAAYRKFLKLFPDDPSVPDVKRQIKQLTAQGAK
jgi:tetratricopeptide (TPR) repeat protein